jgi:hypothetical protein
MRSDLSRQVSLGTSAGPGDRKLKVKLRWKRGRREKEDGEER